MEESISSSRTPGASASVLNGDVDCYASGPVTAVASDDSGWTAYFIDGDDTYLQLHNSQEVPAKKPHGDRASTSTLSTASKTKVKAKKAAGTEENNNKKKPRLEPADEDPLQDTACSPQTLTMQLVNFTCRMVGKLLAVSVSRDHQQQHQHQQRCSGLSTAGDGDANGILGRGRMQKLKRCLLSPS